MTQRIASKLLITLALLTTGLATVAKDPTPPPAMREIVLVRHGHYAADPSIDERTGPGISPLGVAQAKLVAARLRSDLTRVDGLYVSPMQRARDTAAAIDDAFPGQSFDIVDDLAECTPPTRRMDVTAQVKEETSAACKAQFDRAFTRFFETPGAAGRTDLLVCHGNVIRYLVTRALGVDSQAWLEMSPGHASVTRIRIEPDGRFKVIAVGDVGHIPPNLRTGASGDSDHSLGVDALKLHVVPAANRGAARSVRNRRAHTVSLRPSIGGFGFRLVLALDRNKAPRVPGRWIDDLLRTQA